MAGWQEAVENSRTADSVRQERLQRVLHETLVVSEDGVQVDLRVTLGISGYPWAGDNADAIVQRADTQMYAAKAVQKHVPA